MVAHKMINLFFLVAQCPWPLSFSDVKISSLLIALPLQDASFYNRIITITIGRIPYFTINVYPNSVNADIFDSFYIVTNMQRNRKILFERILLNRINNDIPSCFYSNKINDVESWTKTNTTFKIFRCYSEGRKVEGGIRNFFLFYQIS